MLNTWNEILQFFHRVSEALQNEYVNLKACPDRSEFERHEGNATR